MTKSISQLGPDLARRVNRIETAVERSAKDSIRKAAMAAKAEQLDVMSADAGGDLTLSRVRSGKGAKIGARFDINGLTATIKATGPVPLLANPIPPHIIPKQRQRGRRRVIAIPGVGVRASAQHPGTKGKDTWNRGRERAQPKARTVIERNTDAAVKRAFLSGG